MSAAKWRRAMAGQVHAAPLSAPAGAGVRLPGAARSAAAGVGAATRTRTHTRTSTPLTDMAIAPSTWAHGLLLAALLVYPWVASPFFTFQIGGQSLVLGLLALSLALLGGYGGMVTLSQMTVAGIAGYAVAIIGVAGTTTQSVNLGWPWYMAVPLAIAIGTGVATLIGALAVRTEGIYTIMITLAIGVAFYYLAQQNYLLFNGFQGIQAVLPPKLFGLDWRTPLPYYHLALVFAVLGYAGVSYIVRSPFGMALQGIRDNPRRMASLGFNVTAHRIAAHALAGFIASVAGVLFVYYNARISPGTVGTAALLDVLIIAVLGGLKHPIGPFIGALVFVLLQNFAIDLVDRERFNLVIGGVFLAIVLFSPDGLLGLWQRLFRRGSRG